MRKASEREGNFGSRADRVNMSGQGRRQKKRRKDVYLVIGLFLMVAAVALICFVFLFKLHDIRVTNDARRYSDAQITEASGLKTGESLMSVNRKSVAQQIEQTLPYIGTAKVRVRYPDTVDISVEYTRAKLAVEQPDGYVLLDMNGKVLETGAGMLADYVAVITGASLEEAVPGREAVFSEENALEAITRLAKAFDSAGITGVTAYDLSDMSNIVAEVNYNTDIKLGSGSNAEEQLRFGKEVIDRTLYQAKSASSKLVIDLTQEGSAFVRTQENIDAAKKAAQEALTAQYETTTEVETDEFGEPVPTEAPVLETPSFEPSSEEETSAEAPSEEKTSAADAETLPEEPATEQNAQEAAEAVG